MDRRRVTDDFSVSSQLDTHDIETLARAGVRALINNRPDGEHPLQPRTAELAHTAAKLGLEYADLPVVSGTLTEDAIDRFIALREELRTPLVAFCRSGTRSISLWALAEARRLGADAVIGLALEAGYDIRGLRPRLLEQARRRGT